MELTPGEFYELAKRRGNRIRYERYANALTASAVYNVHRGSEDTPIVDAFDFIRDARESAKLDKQREGRKFCQKVIRDLPPATTSREKYLEVRLTAIADLKAGGYDNAAELFNSVWPNLVPTAEEVHHE
jgi:hypothetical protein